MMRNFEGLAMASMLSTVSQPALAQDPLDIAVTLQSGSSNTFWQAVGKGL